MQRAIKQKNGYIEYVWQNVGELKGRAKAGYLAYFTPWDLMIWPSAYKEEFYEMVDLKSLENKIATIKLWDSGYAYVLDKDAKIVFHPYLEDNQETWEFRDCKNGKLFVQQMMKEKAGIVNKGQKTYGKIKYYWKDENENKIREKIVIFKHYEKLDWLICSGVYLDELYEPIDQLRNLIILIAIFVVFIIILISGFVGKSVSKTVKQLSSVAEAIGDGNLDVTIEPESRDEIGYLSDAFNRMTKSLKESKLKIEFQAQELQKSNLLLEEKVNERTRDIEKAKKEAESANRAKSTFLANMGHEIRTPLTSILGNAELMVSSLTKEHDKELLENIRTSVITLKDFIDDTLDMSRIESKKLKISPTIVNIYAILNEIRSNFSFQIREKKLTYIEIIDPLIPQYLEIDKVRMKQILINLIGNAVKFTGKGYVKLVVSAENLDINKNTLDLKILVEDTGIGIPHEYFTKIFEPYESPGMKKKGSPEGYGLGLAITKGIVELMGGEISVDSEVEKGSCFSVLLRNIKISTEQERLSDGEDFDYSTIEFKEQKLLVVDDEKGTRDIIKGYLENTNIQVLEAGNGIQAIEMLKKYCPDVILMDLKMSGMSGIAATEKIRANDELKKATIIAFTASRPNPSDMEKLANLFESYLNKPLSKAQLFFELTRFLKYRSLGKNDVKKGDSFEVSEKFKKIEVSSETKRLLPVIIDDLESSLEIWDLANKSNNFEKIKSFGKKIKAIGENKQVDFLIDYGEAVINSSEIAMINKMKSLLAYYPTLIKKIKSISKEK